MCFSSSQIAIRINALPPRHYIVNGKRKTFAVASDWHFIIASPKCQNNLIAVKCLSVDAKCCAKFYQFLPKFILTLCPHLLNQRLFFLAAYHPDRQDYLHTKQHKEEQPHLQERELVWNNCAGKGFLTDLRTDCHGKRQPQEQMRTGPSNPWQAYHVR